MRLYYNIETAMRRSGGIGKYTFHLVKEAIKSGETEAVFGFDGRQWRELNEDTFGSQTVSDFSNEGSRLRKIARHIPGARNLYELLLKGRFKDVGAAAGNIYHEPDFILRDFPGRKVTTIHDLSFIRHPEFHLPSLVSYFSHRLPTTLKGADRIITVTESIRQELLSTYKLDAERVTAVHHGVDGAFSPTARDNGSPVLDKYGLRSEGYLLSVATLEPRKNLANVLRAFNQLAPGIRQEYPLVLAGCDGWKNTGLMREMKTGVEKGEIKILGYVPEADLSSLYACSRGVVFVPVYEGFGLPALEAMACGAPLLASDIPALREVVGEGGLFVDHRDVDAIEHGLAQLLTEGDRRQQLRTWGLTRAAGFTWQQCAAETIKVYRSLL